MRRHATERSQARTRTFSHHALAWVGRCPVPWAGISAAAGLRDFAEVPGLHELRGARSMTLVILAVDAVFWGFLSWELAKSVERGRWRRK